MGDRMGSSPIDRTKKITCTFIVQVFFLQGSKGLERDVKKTARCAVFSPRRVNRVSGAKNRLFFHFQFLFFKKLEVFLKIC